MQICVRRYHPPDATMTVQIHDTIARTIQRVYKEVYPSPLPRKKMILMFGGRVLDYKKTISECEIYDGAILEVRRRYLNNNHKNYTDVGKYEIVDEYEIDENILLHDIDDLATDWREQYDRTKCKQERKSESR